MGIIGIVAALTIPILLKNFEKKSLKSQFKKQYSTLQQALIKTNFEYVYKCYYIKLDGTDDTPLEGSGCPAFHDALISNLKVVKTCKGNALSEGCIPIYDHSKVSSKCSGFSQNSIDNVNYAYVLADGMIIMPYSKNRGAILLFDINGVKGPNKVGQDVYSIALARVGDVVKLGRTVVSRGANRVQLMECIVLDRDYYYRYLDELLEY